jgi:chemotaxis protein MotB
MWKPAFAGGATMRHWVLVCAVLLAGCVTRGKYDELKQKYDDAQKQLEARQTQIGDLHQQVAAEQAKVQSLETEITAAKQQLALLGDARTAKEAELAALQAEQTKLNDELANLLKDRSQLKESTDRLQQALLELNKRKVEAEKRVAEFKALLAKFKNLIDAGKLQVKLIDGRMVLVLPTDVLFDSGSAKLSKEGVEAVRDVSAVLKTMRDKRFQVEGHTDNVPIRTAQYPSNWELSAARALGVVKAMTEAGMPAEALSAAGYGEYHPAARNDSDAHKRENRRIEIVLVPDLSMLPGFEELKRVVEK